MTDQLFTLIKLMSSGVETLASVYTENGATFPSLDDPFTPDPLSEDPRVLEAAAVITSAAVQLTASVRMPSQLLTQIALSAHFAAALTTVNTLNVPEIIRCAGPKGMTVSQIAATANTDAGKLARIMRLLATQHIFKEVSPNVFAANKLSSALDTGIPFEKIQANPANKYVEGAQGVSAMVGHLGEEAAVSTTHTWMYMKDPKTAFSQEPNVSPFNMAFDTDKKYWEWLELPENRLGMARFGVAMNWTASMGWTQMTAKAFPWGELPKGAVVVDIGGGFGHVTMTLAKAFPHLKYIVEDRGFVVEDAKKLWQEKFPSALQSGLVKFQARDFFDPEPVKDAAVFLLRLVLHDWPTKYAKEILMQARAAAQPSTKLIIVDAIVQFASPASENPIGESIPGFVIPQPPSPLLPTTGSEFLYHLDMQMLMVLNSQERTIAEHLELIDGTGWKLERIAPGIASVAHLILTAV